MTEGSGDPMIGMVLGGRYTVEEKVGSGGMSSVYRARDSVLERTVAVKVMHREFSSDQAFLERFRQEAKAVAKLSHPHIVTVIDAGEDEGHPYIVFEYVEGETLKQLVKRVGQLNVADALAYTIEIGKALQVAHDTGIVHRDVKPQNVLINREGHAKVTDFGIAHTLESDGLTEPGKVIGTTDYISPEQATGSTVTEQSDIYSLGVVLYELLTGSVPFAGETGLSVAMKHVREELPNVQKRRPEISSALAAVVERATAKSPERRYTTVKAMVDELEETLTYEISRSGQSSEEATAVLGEITAGKPAEHRPLSIRRPVFYRWLVAGGALLLLAAVATVAVFAFNVRLGPEVETSAKGRLVQLAKSDIAVFDPAPGDGREHDEVIGALVDGIPNTSWETERYQSPDLGQKSGVGLIVDAGRPIPARELEVLSSKAGYNAQVMAANQLPDTINSGWTLLALKKGVGKDETYKLDTVNRPFRYYLLWITELGGDAPYYAAISRIKLIQ